MHRLLPSTEPNDLPPLENIQRPLERMARVPLLLHKLPHQARITRAPPDRQPSSNVRLDLGDLLHEVAARHALDVAGLHGVHSRELEETDRFVDVVLLHFRVQRHFGERFRNADDGFELAEESRESAMIVVRRERGRTER